jgi:uncharacterized membrane protein YphA (DoxX/SURF4 family)
MLACASTGAELVLGAALILGLFTRWVALLSGILLLFFAGGMSLGARTSGADEPGFHPSSTPVRAQ